MDKKTGDKPVFFVFGFDKATSFGLYLLRLPKSSFYKLKGN